MWANESFDGENFAEDMHKVDTTNRRYEKYYVSIDYGTQNATVFLLWGLYQGRGI